MKYCIGDIHGNYLALLDLLTKINFDYDNDELISLGDIVDGWPQTFECIELLKKIKKLTLIKGNHDEWAIDFLLTTLKDPNGYKNDLERYSWLQQGGYSTVLSYSEGCNVQYSYDHIDFLSKALNYHIDNDNNLFIHAGYYNLNIPTKDENKYDISYLWDRTYVRNKVVNSFGLLEYKGDQNFNKVFIGHTPTIGLDHKKIEDNTKPVINKNIYMMDTGVAFTGYLSCINLDTLEIHQSSKKGCEYYPEHKGRNSKSYNNM